MNKKSSSRKRFIMLSGRQRQPQDQHDGKPLKHWKTFDTDAQKQAIDESESFYREHLATAEFHVLRENAGTEENAGSTRYGNMTPRTGYFACRACGLPLFSAECKMAPSRNTTKACLPRFGCCIEDSILVSERQRHAAAANTHCARCRSNVGMVMKDYRPTMKKSNDDRYYREQHVANGLALAYVRVNLGKDTYTRATALQHPSVVIRNGKPIAFFR